MTKLKAPGRSSGFSHNGKLHKPDKTGHITLPPDAVPEAISHGFTVVPLPSVVEPIYEEPKADDTDVSADTIDDAVPEEDEEVPAAPVVTSSKKRK